MRDYEERNNLFANQAPVRRSPYCLAVTTEKV